MNKTHMFIKNYRKTSQGLSLIEVMISFTILAVGLLALAKMQTLLLKNEAFTEQFAKATNLTHQKITTLRNYTSISGAGNSYQNIQSGSKIITDSNTTYNLDWTIIENNSPSYKEINVKTSWVDQKNELNMINLSSIIGKIDPVLSGQIINKLQSGKVVPKK